MSKVMLINAMRPEEVRAAILDSGRVDQFEIEVRDALLLKGNVYKGRVANVEGSLNACFVEFGVDKQGFLPVDEIAPEAYHKKWKKKERPRITDVMQKGREIMVQVVKDAVGNKGAALTTRISLAGRYIVLMPHDETRGVSRKISNDAHRKKLREIASTLKVPEEYGFIVRTAGMDRTKTDLNRDAAQLVRTWKNIEKHYGGEEAPSLLHEDGDLVVRMLRDYYDSGIERVLIDDSMAFQKAEAYFRRIMPRSKQALQFYSGKVPLFSRYKVEDQIEDIFSRRADLPSGGYILIDPTEALISIDVNSGRSTKQKSQEDTALHTNLEAAREVARQLRLRDLGGLIVIDFIDMPSRKSNRAVEKALKDALKPDKARTYVGQISDNGLLELNRQRLKQALQQQTHRSCPTCEGRGIIPAPDFVARKLLRSIEAKAAGGNYAKVTIQLHPELADHLQNVHRRDLVELENRFGLLVEVEGRPGHHRGEQEIRWSSHNSITDTEKRIVQERREAMIAANKALSGVVLPQEIHSAEMELFGDILADDELEDDEEEDSSELKADSEGDEDNYDGGEPGGRRSRRGRGRNRGRGRGRASGATDPHTNGLQARSSDSDDEDAMSRSKKRRIRRRRRRGDDSETNETSDGQDAAATTNPSGGGSPRSDAGDNDEAPRRSRRRRRGRGRGRSSQDGDSARSDAAGASNDDSSPGRQRSNSSRSSGRSGRGGGRSESSRSRGGQRGRDQGRAAATDKDSKDTAPTRDPSTSTGQQQADRGASGERSATSGGSSPQSESPTILGGLKRYLGISPKGDDARTGSSDS